MSWRRKLFDSLKRIIGMGPSMIRIKCRNPDCTAPDHIFEYDDNRIGANGLGDSDSPDSVLYFIDCPFCQTVNPVWLKRKGLSYGLDVIIVKDEPLDF